MDVLKSRDLGPRVRILLALKSGFQGFADIARATGLSSSTVTKYLDVLVSRGYVVRVRRGVYSITEDGLKLLRELAEALWNAVKG